MMYRIKDEYLDLWSNEDNVRNLIEVNEIEELSHEWGKPIEELMEQVEEVCAYEVIYWRADGGPRQYFTTDDERLFADFLDNIKNRGWKIEYSTEL